MALCDERAYKILSLERTIDRAVEELEDPSSECEQRFDDVEKNLLSSQEETRFWRLRFWRSTARFTLFEDDRPRLHL